MGQYYLCVVLIIFLFILLIHEVIYDCKSIRKPYKRILLCLVLTLLFKYNYGTHFYGLEYEDAYVFSFCARQFLYDIFPTSFLIDAVSVGSLTEPMLTSTYGGHFIMYPTFLSLFTNIFGWSPTILSIANTSIAFFILLILSKESRELVYPSCSLLLCTYNKLVYNLFLIRNIFKFHLFGIRIYLF